MAYTPDSQYNTNIENGFFKSEWAKSYTFFVNPRFSTEEGVKVVVWVIDDISKVNSISNSGRDFLSGSQKQPDGTYLPFSHSGNKALEVSFFNLPKTNPKNSVSLESDSYASFDVNAGATTPNMKFNTPSYYALQERFDKGEETGTKPTSTDSYIDYALITAKYYYKRAIYQLFNNNSKYGLPENAVEFTQNPQKVDTTTPPPNDPPPATDSGKKEVDPTKVSSKIKLVKKSGPGELTGVVEVDVSEGKATFTGIQFDQPGTYVVEVMPSNLDLEKTEFTVEVDPEPKNIEQSPKKEEAEKKSGERPIIAQIDEPNVKLKPIERELPKSEGDAIAQASSVGVKPILAYGGKEIASDVNIRSMKLYYDENIPKCKIEFRDQMGILQETPPADDTKFEIFLNSTDVDIKCIHIAFKITNHKQLGQSWLFEGTIHIDDLYVPSSKTYNGTSFEVLRKISKKLNIGFNSNIDNTDDEMRWINTNKDYRYFIKDIIDHSYKDETSFMYGYIDYYYCFNYVDIEKEWKRETKSDFMVETGGISKYAKTPNTKFSPLVLTNEPSEKDSVGYFTNFKILNQSTATKIDSGYKTVTRYYDEEKKAFLEFTVDSQSTDDGKNLILKGEQGDNKFAEKKVGKRFLGKVDNDNVHKNYNYAKTQNRINLDNLTSISCTITLPNLNFNLYRFQKVSMIFRLTDSSPSKEYQTDFRYTGDWVIIDIDYEYVVSTKGNKFEQRLKLVRKELGKNPKEMEETPPAQETKEGNKNENQEQTKPEPKPNAKYKVGDLVTVIKNDGTKYEVEITKILENGNEVEGKLKKI